jgi:hypothetical protein
VITTTFPFSDRKLSGPTSMYPITAQNITSFQVQSEGVIVKDGSNIYQLRPVRAVSLLRKSQTFRADEPDGWSHTVPS